MDCIDRREVKVLDIWSDNDGTETLYFVSSTIGYCLSDYSEIKSETFEDMLASTTGRYLSDIGYYLLDSQTKPLRSCDTCENRLQCLIDEGIEK